jgi:hypothetical protein
MVDNTIKPVFNSAAGVAFCNDLLQQAQIDAKDLKKSFYFYTSPNPQPKSENRMYLGLLPEERAKNLTGYLYSESSEGPKGDFEGCFVGDKKTLESEKLKMRGGLKQEAFTNKDIIFSTSKP